MARRIASARGRRRNRTVAASWHGPSTACRRQPIHDIGLPPRPPRVVLWVEKIHRKLWRSTGIHVAHKRSVLFRGALVGQLARLVPPRAIAPPPLRTFRPLLRSRRAPRISRGRVEVSPHH